SPTMRVSFSAGRNRQHTVVLAHAVTVACASPGIIAPRTSPSPHRSTVSSWPCSVAWVSRTTPDITIYSPVGARLRVKRLARRPGVSDHVRVECAAPSGVQIAGERGALHHAIPQLGRAYVRFRAV